MNKWYAEDGPKGWMLVESCPDGSDGFLADFYTNGHDAHRAAVCHNALTSVPTEALESGAIAELIAAVREVMEHWILLPGDMRTRLESALASLKLVKEATP